MASAAKKTARPRKPLPRTPVRPKVATKHVTPSEAARWLADEFRKQRNGEGEQVANEEKKSRRLKKPLPRTPVRPKVITKYMTPDEAAQWLLDDFRKQRNGG